MCSFPPEEAIMFVKFDLSDVLWRMLLVQESADKWNFAYVLPCAPGEQV